MQMNQKTLIIYHAYCDDGFGAAYAAWKKFGDTAEYYPAKHGEAPPDVVGKSVFILDFSYPLAMMQTLLSQADSMTILDHHQTAIDQLADLFAQGQLQGLFDNHRSGAVIAWQYFHPEQAVPDLLYHIQDRDLWQFNLAGTEEITIALRSYEMRFSSWDYLISRGLASLHQEGVPILRFYRKKVAELVSKASMADIAGYTVPMVNAPSFMASDIGDQLSENQAFAVVYYDNADYRYFSLRSRPSTGIDVAQIAQQFGGGGHKQASGFRLSLNQLDKLAIKA